MCSDGTLIRTGGTMFVNLSKTAAFAALLLTVTNFPAAAQSERGTLTGAFGKFFRPLRNFILVPFCCKAFTSLLGVRRRLERRPAEPEGRSALGVAEAGAYTWRGVSLLLCFPIVRRKR